MQSMLMTVIVALVALMCYAVGQQVLRQDANYPQVQIAQDLGTRQSMGDKTAFPERVTKVNPSVVSQKLRHYQSFAQLDSLRYSFDQSGRPISSTAILNGRTPVPPPGMLLHARCQG